MSTMSLPSMEHSFTLDVKGEETHKPYSGEFTYKRLSLGNRAEVDKLYQKLTEGLLTLPTTDLMYYDMISHLRFGLTKFPDWWKDSLFGKELYDANVVTDIYKECMKFEADWEAKVEELVKPKA